jgi:hypothetical protein
LAGFGLLPWRDIDGIVVRWQAAVEERILVSVMVCSNIVASSIIRRFDAVKIELENNRRCSEPGKRATRALIRKSARAIIEL